MAEARLSASLGQAGHTAPSSGSGARPVRFFGERNLKLAARSMHGAAGGPPGAHRAVLKSLVTQVAIPHLMNRHLDAPAQSPPPSLPIEELVQKLLAADPTEAFELVGSLQSAADSPGAFCATVLEPSARRLGDLWKADDCSDVEVTIGMHRLQAALRRTSMHKQASMASHAGPGLVLVAQQPGDLHMLGSVLDAELLWQAGWLIHCEFPGTDQALQDLLAKTWFEALVLSTSLAFRHEHRLAHVTRTISQAREHSRNPDLRIVVGGRMFFERPGAGRQVGADASIGSASQVEALILRTAGKRVQPADQDR